MYRDRGGYLVVEVVKLLQPKFFLRFETMFSVPLPKDSSLCWFWEKSQYAEYYGYVAVNVWCFTCQRK